MKIIKELAVGVAKGEYALWLGSGISRERVPGLRIVVRRVLDHLSDGARAEAGDGPFTVALTKAVGLALTNVQQRADRSIEINRTLRRVHADLASPRADDATIVRVNQDGRHHIPHVRGPWTPSWLPSKRPVNGSGPRSSKRVAGTRCPD